MVGHRRRPGYDRFEAYAYAMNSGFIGVLTFEIHIPEASSLKEKRRHLRHTKAQLERRFSASVAEVDHHDLWQRGRLTMVLVRRSYADTVHGLDDAERYLSGQEYELAGASRTVLSVEDDL